jgi:hypothetical protein
VIGSTAVSLLTSKGRAVNLAPDQSVNSTIRPVTAAIGEAAAWAMIVPAEGAVPEMYVCVALRCSKTKSPVMHPS